MTVTFSDYLAAEWKPALGCTEPACIAYAAALAAGCAQGEVRGVHLRCDPRIYKNCYAVGIPHSGRRTGIRWALAIGSLIDKAQAGLEVFRQVTPSIIAEAGRILEKGSVTVEVDSAAADLLVDCRVVRSGGTGRAVIERDHTRVVRLECDGNAVAAGETASQAVKSSSLDVREALSSSPFEDLLALSRSLTEADRSSLRRGAEINIAIARHGLTLFPRAFMNLLDVDPLTRISRLVCAGVHARMSGEDFLVMSLAGSGNKGIVTSVPITLWGNQCGADRGLIDEVMAFSCLLTSATTFHLGTLSAACGCSNAAGIGLAAGLVILQGGGLPEVGMAVNNVVGNVAGMVCDGAKIGCALKTMTSVDAAFRAASLALNGIGIPETDGIVGGDGMESILNLGRIAGAGMSAMDGEILSIMQAKLRREGA